MNTFFRIEELVKKAIYTFKTYGISELSRKTKIFLKKNLLGKNFTSLIARGSYRLLWFKVFESLKSKGLAIFLLRFLLVLFFGWVVFFIKPKEIDFVPDGKILSWYRKNKRKVSIVIPTYNDFQLTKNCIESIRKYSKSEDINIIVVDDASPDKMITKLLKHLPATVLERTENGGFAKAVNTGLRQTENEDVIILNNDTLVQKGWLEVLQYWAYSDDTIGIVGPKLIYPDQTIQWAGTFRNQNQKDWFDHYYRNTVADSPETNFSHPVLAATGACMYIKRSVIEKVGLFDENFGMAFEDVDFSLRSWLAEFKVVYCPKSVVIHLESRTRGRKQGKREVDSLNYFWEKWKSWFEDRPVLSEEGKLKIIYVNQDNGVGGGPRVIFEHLNRLQARGHDVTLFTVDKAPDWFPLSVPVRTFKNYVELKAVLKTEKALKVATWWETSETVWEASLENGIPVFLVQDVESSYYKQDPEYQPKVLSHYRKEFNYLTVSSWDQEKLAELGVDATVVTPGISEIFTQKNLKREEDVLLAVGRSHYLKNFDLTAKAWKLLSKRPKLKLFGTEPRLGKQLNVPYNFKPTDQQVVDLYNQATVFIQTSIHEGFCLPILEAMACGCPVITTNSDGNRDFIFDQKNCLQISKTDPKDVAKKIEKLFADKSLQDKLALEGLKIAESYRWDKKIEELETFYYRLAKEYGNN